MWCTHLQAKQAHTKNKTNKPKKKVASTQDGENKRGHSCNNLWSRKAAIRGHVLCCEEAKYLQKVEMHSYWSCMVLERTRRNRVKDGACSFKKSKHKQSLESYGAHCLQPEGKFWLVRECTLLNSRICSVMGVSALTCTYICLWLSKWLDLFILLAAECVCVLINSYD